MKLLPSKRVAKIALRKSFVVAAVIAFVTLLEHHNVFLRIGKGGEFIIASVTDHLVFGWGD